MSQLETEAYNAGRRFRGSSRERALNHWNSQQNTIGYPYLNASDWAAAQRAFLRGAGHKW